MSFKPFHKLTVIGGRGGHASTACFDSKNKKKVPHGGSGGKGGNVYAVASSAITSWPHQNVFQGNPGKAGGDNTCRGRAGKDIYILLPLHTIFYEDKEYYGSIHKEGDTLLLASGGDGGIGNIYTNEKPLGVVGETHELTARLIYKFKIGILGQVNSGKTTLFNLLTNSQAVVKEYPYNTTQPNFSHQHQVIELTSNPRYFFLAKYCDYLIYVVNEGTVTNNTISSIYKAKSKQKICIVYDHHKVTIQSDYPHFTWSQLKELKDLIDFK